RGLYGDVIMEIDWSVGQILEALEENGLEDNTLVIFTSDNGPWLPYKNHGGSAHPLRNGKGSTYEGGQRVPCIMWAPGRIPAGTETDALTTTMDLMPSIAQLSEAELKPRGPIDGFDISAVIHGKGPSLREEFLYYSRIGKLEGFRKGDWKLRITPEAGIELFNLADDVGETTNLADRYPARVKSLHARMQSLDDKLTDHIRPNGQL
ncbi:MAG: sulfatase-like hydrolase/transferase, partial [Opitutales bacterium]